MEPLQILQTSIRHPELVIGRMNCYITHTINNNYYNTEGVNIFNEDWDNLIILDACRYDYFSQISTLPGELESRVSRGSTSKEFIRGNFQDTTAHDVVYVSANGWYANLKNELNSEIYDFQMVKRDAVEGLTSHPKTVADSGLKAHSEFPNKRLIIHFLQPHQPFLGDSSEKFNFKKGFPETVKQSNVTQQEIIQAYKENIRIVLPEVERLLEEFSGKTVVSADHGELLGDRMQPLPAKIYGHPEGVYVDELVKVPWHIYESNRRKNIIKEKPVENSTINQNEIRDHLKDLGYVV